MGDRTTSERATGDAVAIVGMACRVPGADSVEAFWRLMVEGDDPIRRTGPDRWGGRIDGVERFDAGFFGITPREARGMDPQQRLLLEVGHDALQDAGTTMRGMAGSDAGVFVAQHTGDYALLQAANGTDADAHAVMGSARGITSGRLSFALDLRGPSVTVDAACSSSLVAVHLAVRSLRSGECPVALVGAVNLVLLPALEDAFAAAGMAAADGRCKFGDARADGFVRSDGVAALVLKPLADARRDGNRVHASLLGSAVNNDGRAGGYLITPAVDGQERMLRAAYRDAGVDPADVDYVEAHGTGTPVGDPVELGALARVLTRGRPTSRPCLVGSAKTTVGHTESAAGLVGLIRAALCLRHALVPPAAGLGELNPEVDWSGLELPRHATALAPRGRPMLAGVSSFGLSGTNAHVVLAEPGPEPAVPCPDGSRPALLVVSARDPQALDVLTSAHRDLLLPGAPGRAVPLATLAHGAAQQRDQHEYRVAIAAGSHDDAVARLDDVLAGRFGRCAQRGGPVEERPRVAFVFPGQGGQWAGMGRELLATEPVFARAVLRCDAAVRVETGWSVLEHLTTAGSARAGDIDVVQPALWSLEVGLAELWRSWGIEPDVVIGHSMGEVAAAYVAGALTLADAAAVVCRRSRLARPLSGRGAMVLTGLAEDAAVAAIAGHEDAVSVAACNGPTSTVLSGDHATLADIVEGLRRDDVLARWIDADIASHSPQMDAVRTDLEAGLCTLEPRAGTVPIHSTVLGERISGAELGAAYWSANLRRPVRFLDAVRDELAGGDTVFVEMGPHPVLTAAAAEIIDGCRGRGTAVGSLRRGEPERMALLASLGTLFVAGVPVTGTGATGTRTAPHVDLPSYPWQRATHWTGAATGGAPAPHPLLGAERPAEGGLREWVGRLDPGRHPFLDDHRVEGMVIAPGTAYVELLSVAAGRVLGGPVALRDLRFERALFVGHGAAPEVSTTVEPGDHGELRCAVRSRSGPDLGWTGHVTAVAVAAAEPMPDVPDTVADVRLRCSGHLAGAEFYRDHAERGNSWGAAFRGVEEVWIGDGEVLGRLSCPDPVRDDLARWGFHPAWLDACLHPLAAAAPPRTEGQGSVFVLGGIDEVRTFRAPPVALWSRVRSTCAEGDTLSGDVLLVDHAGEPVAEVRGLRLRYLAGDGAAGDDGLHVLRWVPTDGPHPAQTPAVEGGWIVLACGDGDAGGGDAVVEGLRRAGQRVTRVRAGTGFARDTDTEFAVDPGCAGHLEQVVREVARRGPCRGVVHLWSTGVGVPAATWTARDRALVCGGLPGLVRALDGPGLGEPTLWLVTSGAQATGADGERHAPFQAPLWGMGRALAAEEPHLHPVLVDVDRGAAGAAALTAELLATPPGPVAEDQLVLRGTRRWVARLEPVPVAPVRTPAPPAAARVEPRRPGELDGLALVPAARPVPGRGEVRIAVAHVGLNFQDVLLATGLYPDDGPEPPAFGKDCAGVVDAVGEGVTELAVGDEVVALAAATMGTHVVTSAQLAVRAPARLTLAEAATLPGPYVTALHGLVDVAGLRPGETVLIHSAAGGVGQAALQVALWCGATVLATAGTQEKRTLLRDSGVAHVADSRTSAFAEQFRAVTGEGGVDVILNSLTGAAVPANLGLLGPYGRYVELSKRDFQDNTPLGSAALRGNRSFTSVDVVDMIRNSPGRTACLLRRAVELVDRGMLDPLPHERFPAAEPEAAFRRMARSLHVGRVLLSFTPPVARPHATCLVTGGLGVLGSEVARWLVDEGAREVLLTGRTPLPDRGTWDRLPFGSPHAAGVATVQAIEAAGARVQYAAVDTADHHAMAALLAGRESAGHPPVRGALHLAGVLDRRPVRDLAPADVDAGLRAKIDGAWTLHRLLPEPDHLVLFSSASALLGSPMLGLYAAGNAFLDALARFRRAQGRPATAVNWGFWDAPGMGSPPGDGPARPRGVRTIPVATGLAVLRDLLVDGVDDAVVMPVDWAQWADAHPAAAAAPLLRRVVPAAAEAPSPRAGAPAAVPEPAAGPEPTAPPVAAPEPAAPPVEQTPGAVTEVPRPRPPLPVPPPVTAALPHPPPTPGPGAAAPGPAKGGPGLARTVREQAAAVVGMATEHLPSDRALDRVGMDSLMAAELRTKIHRSTGVRLPIGLMLAGATVASLAAAVQDRIERPEHSGSPAAV